MQKRLAVLPTSFFFVIMPILIAKTLRTFLYYVQNKSATFPFFSCFAPLSG